MKPMLCVLGLSFAAAAFGTVPVVDNEQVTVWDTSGPMGPSPHDFVTVSLSNKGTAKFGHQGDIPGKPGSRTIVIELKKLPVNAPANESGYPLAFPRRNAKKLLENARVVVWDYVWRPGEPTPMHFHDKDAVVVFEATGALKATTLDGNSAVTEITDGEVRFNPRGRVHAEVLANGEAHAVVTELR